MGDNPPRCARRLPQLWSSCHRWVSSSRVMGEASGDQTLASLVTVTELSSPRKRNAATESYETILLGLGCRCCRNPFLQFPTANDVINEINHVRTPVSCRIGASLERIDAMLFSCSTTVPSPRISRMSSICIPSWIVPIGVLYVPVEVEHAEKANTMKAMVTIRLSSRRIMGYVFVARSVSNQSNENTAVKRQTSNVK